MLAGARSFTAVGEWAADAPPRVLAALGIRYDPLAGRFQLPDEANPPGRGGAGRGRSGGRGGVVAGRSAASLLPAARSWAAGAAGGGGGRQGGARHPACQPHGQARHLLAAADQQAGAVLAQAEVDCKTNEITAFAPLLAPLDLAGAVVTADALHAQREHAQFLVTSKHAHYILTVKSNQPSLHAQLRNLPWRQVPAASTPVNAVTAAPNGAPSRSTAVAAGLAFPHAAQAIQIRRRRKPLSGTRKWSAQTSYAITSLAATRRPAQLAGWMRGHWGIEARTTSAMSPSAKTPPRSAPATAPRSWPPCATWPSESSSPAGHPSIAAACRYHARDATRVLATLGISPP